MDVPYTEGPRGRAVDDGNGPRERAGAFPAARRVRRRLVTALTSRSVIPHLGRFAKDVQDDALHAPDALMQKKAGRSNCFGPLERH
jgi:hypothetical protein